MGGMYLDGKKIFLAGATGLVGTAILQEILRRHPTTVVRAISSGAMLPFLQDPRIEYHQADLRDLDKCRRLACGCDCAIMAATANAAGAGGLVTRPWQQINDNVRLYTQMLQAFHEAEIKRVLCISSITVYQEFDGSIREVDLDMNLDPPAAHFGVGWMGRFAEKMCQFWHDQTGIEIVRVRAANVYGPFARFDPLRANFIPAIIRKAVERQDPFVVWGRPDVTRDVIYAEDFARAILALLNDLKIINDVFNVGSGIRTTVGEVVELALRCAGHLPAAVRYDTSAPMTHRFRALDCSKIQSAVAWRPEYSIAKGVEETLRWWDKNRSWWIK